GGLTLVVALDVAASAEGDGADIEPDPRGVGGAAGRDQDVAALERALARRRAQREADALARATLDAERLRRLEDVESFLAQDLPHLVRDIRILAVGKQRTARDDRHAAAKPAASLSH